MPWTGIAELTGMYLQRVLNRSPVIALAHSRFDLHAPRTFQPSAAVVNTDNHPT